MNIIGISGLERSMSFKRKEWPGLEEREYRISQGHDSAAAIIVDGEVVAAVAEERFSRKKHTGDFPAHAIRYCLAEAKLSMSDVDFLTHGFDYTPYRRAFSLSPQGRNLYHEVYSRESLLEMVDRDFPGFPSSRVLQVPHHLSHAASAHLASGWDESLTVVIDGMGESASATAYKVNGNKFEKLHEIAIGDSIGILYSLVTLHLGFDFNSDEYKIMGLAPYGNPAKYRSFFERNITLDPDGGFHIPMLRLNRTPLERETYLASRAYLSEHLIAERRPDTETTQEHCDVAAALQECLDRTVLHFCASLGKKTGLRRLAMAGGVALNCTANGRLRRSGVFEEIYVQPAAGDDGSALGAALYTASQKEKMRNVRSPVPFLGPAYSILDIDSALATFAEKVEVHRFPDLDSTCADAASLIQQGRVVAWYRGRMEFGPRALGHRSILADPGHPEMRDRINAMVKMREAFRPFAPAVTLEQTPIWFDVEPGIELPYMIVIENVREEYREQLPAVTHVDGSARIQTVSKEGNSEFHTLLEAMRRETGRAMLLNTSFNVKGQPIVNTPMEAIETFLRTGIDYLYMENARISRR